MSDEESKNAPSHNDDYINLNACLEMDDKISRCVNDITEEPDYEKLLDVLCHYMCCCEFYGARSASVSRQKQ